MLLVEFLCVRVRAKEEESLCVCVCVVIEKSIVSPKQAVCVFFDVQSPGDVSLYCS